MERWQAAIHKDYHSRAWGKGAETCGWKGDSATWQTDHLFHTGIAKRGAKRALSGRTLIVVGGNNDARSSRFRRSLRCGYADRQPEQLLVQRQTTTDRA